MEVESIREPESSDTDEELLPKKDLKKTNSLKSPTTGLGPFRTGSQFVEQKQMEDDQPTLALDDDFVKPKEPGCTTLLNSNLAVKKPVDDPMDAEDDLLPTLAYDFQPIQKQPSIKKEKT